MKLMKFINKRGGRIVLNDIEKPEVHSEVTAAEAMELALELEKKVNQVRNRFHNLNDVDDEIVEIILNQ